MRNKIYIFILSILFVGGLVYLLMPSPKFPSPPPDSLQSQEPADTETLLRRAYFTNYTRAQVLVWYEKQFGWGYWLNYPPEDAQTIIRDQTRSTFLEEIVHPFRESLFVNGFEPSSDNTKDAINIAGKHWRQKIIVRSVPSSPVARVIVLVLTLALGAALVREYSHVRVH